MVFPRKQTSTPSTSSNSTPFGGSLLGCQDPNGLKPILDSREYISLNPNPIGGDILFSGEDNRMEYQFFVRYACYVLSLVDCEEDGLSSVLSCSFSKAFLMGRTGSSNNQSLGGSWKAFGSFFSSQEEAQSSKSFLPNSRAGPQGPHSELSVAEDAKFIFKMTQRCCFSLLTALGGLEVMIRLKRGNLCKVHRSNWRAVWVVCMLISEKMWEDNFVHPQHIITMLGSHSHSKRDFLMMQLSTLALLKYDVNISEERFAALLKEIMGRPVPAVVLQTLPPESIKQVFIPRPLPSPPKIVGRWNQSKLGHRARRSYYHLRDRDNRGSFQHYPGQHSGGDHRERGLPPSLEARNLSPGQAGRSHRERRNKERDPAHRGFFQ